MVQTLGLDRDRQEAHPIEQLVKLLCSKPVPFVAEQPINSIFKAAAEMISDDSIGEKFHGEECRYIETSFFAIRYLHVVVPPHVAPQLAFSLTSQSFSDVLYIIERLFETSDQLNKASAVDLTQSTTSRGSAIRYSETVP